MQVSLEFSYDAIYPAMNTPFGLRGTIHPPDSFRGKQESFAESGFEVSVRDGVIEIGFRQESEADAARALVQRYLGAFNYANNIHYRVNLNQSWRVTPEGTKAMGVSISDELKISNGVLTTTVTQQAKAYIIKNTYDSSHLNTQVELVRKCQKDPALDQALKHFDEEVIDSDRPLYGIFKALDKLAKALPGDGRAKLGKLAGRDRTYVSEVMETAQTERHHSGYAARRLLSDEECRQRARVLIDAYVRTV